MWNIVIGSIDITLQTRLQNSIPMVSMLASGIGRSPALSMFEIAKCYSAIAYRQNRDFDPLVSYL